MDFQFNTKQALLDALEARRKWAIAYDKKNKTEHAAKEAAALKLFRERCRAALKWSYKQLKAGGFEASISWKERPSCPMSAVQKLDSTLAMIRVDGRKRFKVSERTFRDAHFILSYDENAKQDMCA